MMILPNSTYLNNIGLEAHVRAENSLARTQRGFSIDLVSPLVPDRHHPQEGRALRAFQLRRVTLPTEYDWLSEAEEAQEAKIGPYSIMLPFDERVEQVSTYFHQGHTHIHADAAAYATEELAELVSHKLAAVSIETAFDSMPKGTNLGFPWLTSDKEYLPRVLERARAIRTEGYRQSVLDPAMVYWRGQPKGPKDPPKQRTVWGFPHHYTVFELMLQIPLLEYLRLQSDFSAWVSPEAVSLAVTDILDSAEYPVLSVDFSGFDASVPAVVAHEVFSVLKRWFKGRDSHLIEFVERVFLEIPLMTPIGLLTGRDGAVPSGSGVTNAVGGLIQKWVIHYAAYRMRNRVRHHMVQGDDGVVDFAEPWELKDLEDIVRDELGMVVSADKGTVSTDRVSFLQNWHSKDYRIDGICVGVRPLMRVLNGALSYERMHKGHDWTGFMDTIRWYQQWETARYHPAFPEFVDLLYEWDKYSREYAADSILKEAGGLEMAKSLLDERSFPYGKESLTGLDGFEVVRLLRARGRVGRSETL